MRFLTSFVLLNLAVFSEAIGYKATKDSSNQKSIEVLCFVHGFPITTQDVQNRFNLWVKPDIQKSMAPEVRKKNRETILEILIEELVLAMAAQPVARLDPQACMQEKERILSQSTPEDRKRFQDPVLDRELNKLVRSRVLWQNYLQKFHVSSDRISEPLLQARFQQWKKAQQQARYTLSECVLFFRTMQERKKAWNKAENIQLYLQNGESFSALAKTFSESSTASEGGSLGVLSEDQIQRSWKPWIHKMPVGSASGPWVIEAQKGLPGRFYFFFLEAKEPASSKPLSLQQESQVKERLRQEMIQENRAHTAHYWRMMHMKKASINRQPDTLKRFCATS